MAPKAVVIGPGQTRLDGFFARFKRASEESSRSPPSSISRGSEASLPAARPERSQPNLLSPQRPTPIPKQSPTSETQPLSPQVHNQTPRRLSTQTYVLSPKRSRVEYEDDDEDDDDGIGMIPIGAPPRKSPRTSPKPQVSRREDSFCRSESTSSALSTLRSSTPADPSLSEALPTRREQSTTPRPHPSHLDHRASKPPVRPSTSTSNASAIHTSFGSTRTAIPTSSLRCIKNGQEQVRNSDSEGSDELEDLEDILGFNKPVASSSPLTVMSETPTPPPSEAFPRRSSRSTRGTTSMQGQEATLLPEAKTVKYDLSALIARARQYNRNRANAQNDPGVDRLQSSDEDLPADAASRNKQIEAMLKATGREDDTARFMEAINRTEALVQDKTWSFFDRGQFRKPRRIPGYSELDCGGHPAEAFLRSEEQIKDALVCGYFQQLTMSARLPEAMSYWVFQHALYDQEADVRASCIDAMSPGLMDVSGPEINHWIRTELKQMGMRDEVTGWDHTPAVPERFRGSAILSETTNWSGLQQIFRIISTLAPTLTTEAIIENICTLVRMAIDVSVIEDPENQRLLAAALGSCFERLRDQKESAKVIDEALAAVYSQTHDDEFRLRILEALPQSDFTAALARRKLAIAWFYNDASLFAISSEAIDPQAVAESALLNLEIVQAHIEGQDDVFRIKRSTDYALLKFKLETLAIGLGDGDQLALTQKYASAKNPKDLEDAIRNHNMLADEIAVRTAKMHAKIVDKGTSHVARTVVKELLERLRSKLLYVVRTKPPPRRDIWTKQRDASMMNYLTRTTKDKEEAEEAVVHYEPVVLKPKPTGRVQLFKRKQ